MKEKLINNLGLKILSVFLAFFVWLVVMNVSNPLVTGSEEVALDIVNDQVLTAAGRTYEISGKRTVTVMYDVHTRDDYRIRSSDFRAYVDLAELYDVTGSVQVKVEVLNNQGLVSNVAARPGVVRVETEELQSKKFDLRAERSGDTEDGFAYGGADLSPSFVTVTGPISQVGQISYAGVEISVDGLSSNAERIVEPKFYDANGNEVNLSDRMEVDVNEINCQIYINRVKNLPLDFELKGTVADGYQFTGVESSVREVAVTGLRTNLAEVNKVTIPSTELNLGGATQDVTVVVDIREYLPEGVKLVETQNPQIEVRLKVERLVTRTVSMNADQVELQNGSEAYRYLITPGRIEVVVQGLAEDLDSLSGSDLGAYVDLRGIEPGTYRGDLRFEADAAFEIISFGDIQLDVRQDSTVVEAGGSQGAEENSSESSSSSGHISDPEGAGAEMSGTAETKAESSGRDQTETREGSSEN